MSNHTTLIGTESVEKTSRNMQNSAENISRSETNLEVSLERHRELMDEWLSRLEGILDADYRRRLEMR